jgi:hypothetical protein
VFSLLVELSSPPSRSFVGVVYLEYFVDPFVVVGFCEVFARLVMLWFVVLSIFLIRVVTLFT